MLLGALREQQQLRKGCFGGKLLIFEGLEPQKTRETRSRAQSPAHPHQIGLHGPDCNSKYAAGSPARPSVTVGELFSKNVVRRRLWKDTSPMREPGELAWGLSEDAMGRAGACRPVRTPWSPPRQSARKEAELVKWAGAPTRHQLHQVRRGPPRRGSM